jgi:hypothetical protein
MTSAKAKGYLISVTAYNWPKVLKEAANVNHAAFTFGFDFVIIFQKNYRQ